MTFELVEINLAPRPQASGGVKIQSRLLHRSGRFSVILRIATDIGRQLDFADDRPTPIRVLIGTGEDKGQMLIGSATVEVANGIARLTTGIRKIFMIPLGHQSLLPQAPLPNAACEFKITENDLGWKFCQITLPPEWGPSKTPAAALFKKESPEAKATRRQMLEKLGNVR